MKIGAVVPAYNEESTVGGVVRAIAKSGVVGEVVVVDDGSGDGTASAASAAGARVIRLQSNTGKGGAMKAGLDATDADVIVFLDADLVGLRPEHVRTLLEPVAAGRADVAVGLFDKGRMATDLALKIAPWLSGQRSMKRSVLRSLDMEITRFGVEIALTKHIYRKGFAVEEVVLKNLTHRLKEEKRGFVKGFQERLKMYWEILKQAIPP